MAKKERYLVIYPSGRMKWIETEHENICVAFREAIGCNSLENVRLRYGLCCVVDECGKIQNPPQQYNPFSSAFYNGFFFGDPLVGPAVFCKIGLVDGEWDWVPLDVMDLRKIQAVTGLLIPE